MLGAFTDFLNDAASRCSRLYILGDLFDFWLGDDDTHNPWIAGLVQALRNLNAAGVEVFFMRGNRDFLLGQAFCAHTQMKLLADPCVITAFDRRVLLSHGDLFCTLDSSYQKWRSLVHWHLLQRLYLSLPLGTRQAIAVAVARRLRGGRRVVDAQYLKKTDAIAETVTDYLRKYPADLVIHGHTHRPAVHCQAGAHGTVDRIVIGDWGNENTVVALDAQGCQRTTFAPDLIDEPNG